MKRSSARGTLGFTLIEVLVALTIVAITLGAGIKAAGALTNNSQRRPMRAQRNGVPTIN